MASADILESGLESLDVHLQRASDVSPVPGLLSGGDQDSDRINARASTSTPVLAIVEAPFTFQLVAVIARSCVHREQNTLSLAGRMHTLGMDILPNVVAVRIGWIF